MKTIWKYTLKMTDQQIITMPLNSTPLSVQMKDTVPCLWVLVSPDQPPEDRVISIHGTGHPLSRTAVSFIDTFQIGSLVFHAFGDR